MMYDTVLPAPCKEPTFADVDEVFPYRAAIGWAQEKGIVSGYDSTRFGGSDKLTAAQALTILYRYAVSPNIDENAAAGALNSFPLWAKNAAVWALLNNLINEGDLINNGRR